MACSGGRLASGQVAMAKVANGMVNMQLVNGLTVDLEVLAGRSSAAEVSPSSDAGATTVLTGSVPDLTALLYTSSRGERRIRVHTLCIPTSANLQEIIQVGTS